MSKSIGYKPPMIRAKQAGLKNNTRRGLSIKGFRDFYDFGVAATPGYDWEFRRKDGVWQSLTNEELLARLPYQRGDVLVVKENLRWDSSVSRWRYEADNLTVEDQPDPCGPNRYPHGVIPAMFCPYKCTRMTDVVTDVRVQRLQDISEEDAVAEGIREWGRDPGFDTWKCEATDTFWGTPRLAYKSLWESINGPGSWALNPWVVAYTTEQHMCNIQEMK